MGCPYVVLCKSWWNWERAHEADGEIADPRCCGGRRRCGCVASDRATISGRSAFAPASQLPARKSWPYTI
jgi:hypothetical protein